MIIYRVYRPYHDSSESGTHEYGCYSTLEVAQARALNKWKQIYSDVEPKIEEYSVGGSVGWEYDYICIEPIQVDEDREEKNVGYT